MTPWPNSALPNPRSVGRHCVAACFALLACSFTVWSSVSFAQPGGSVAIRPVAKPAPEQGARWAELKPAQQSALKPLEREWAQMDAPQKQKWMELSARFPKMTPPEQARVQERMGEWTKLTPQQRGQARLRFQEAKTLPPQDRQARWEAYQSLPPEEKRRLALRESPASAPLAGARKLGSTSSLPDKADRDQPQAKSNIVPNPLLVAPSKAIGPTVVQASPGVTTTSIAKRPMPPAHQQSGLPKIAATPEFVDKATLLPQRGPQGEAARPAGASGAGRPAQK